MHPAANPESQVEPSRPGCYPELCTACGLRQNVLSLLHGRQWYWAGPIHLQEPESPREK